MTGGGLRQTLHLEEREDLHPILRLREREDRPLLLHQEGEDPPSCPLEEEDPDQTQTEGREVSRQLRRPAG